MGWWIIVNMIHRPIILTYCLKTVSVSNSSPGILKKVSVKR